MAAAGHPPPGGGRRGGGGQGGPKVNLKLMGSPTIGTKDPRKEFDITVTFLIRGEAQTADLPLMLGVADQPIKHTLRDAANNPVVVNVLNGVGRLEKLNFSAYPAYTKLSVLYSEGGTLYQDTINLPDIQPPLPEGAKPEAPKVIRMKLDPSDSPVLSPKFKGSVLIETFDDKGKAANGTVETTVTSGSGVTFRDKKTLMTIEANVTFASLTVTDGRLHLEIDFIGQFEIEVEFFHVESKTRCKLKFVYD